MADYGPVEMVIDFYFKRSFLFREPSKLQKIYRVLVYCHNRNTGKHFLFISLLIILALRKCCRRDEGVMASMSQSRLRKNRWLNSSSYCEPRAEKQTFDQNDRCLQSTLSVAQEHITRSGAKKSLLTCMLDTDVALNFRRFVLSKWSAHKTSDILSTFQWQVFFN